MTSPDALRQASEELSRCRRVVEASYALHSTLELDEVLTLLVDAAREGVDADRATVFLLSEDGQELWSKVLTGDGDLVIRLPVGQGIAGSVAATGKAVRLNDVQGDPRFDRSWDERSGYVTRQLLTAPIRRRDGGVVGVFQLLNKREGEFTLEDEAFLAALSLHASLAVENARLHRAQLEKERQDREILLVQNVQRAYLPERMESSVQTVRAAAMNLLCEDASGDYYDFITLPRGRLAAVIGDVAGHGLGAALVMAQARALLRAFSQTVDDLGHILNLLNDALCRDMSAGRFISLFVAVTDVETGEVAWSNAGHPPALLLRAGTGRVERLMPQGRVLGVLPDAGFGAPLGQVLEPGDVLLLYTDGATEACSPEGPMLEEDGLADVLRQVGSRAPAGILEGVRDALVAWTGQDEFKDDLTMVAVKRESSRSSSPA